MPALRERRAVVLLGSRTLNKRMSLFVEGLVQEGYDVCLFAAPRGRWSAERFERGIAHLNFGRLAAATQGASAWSRPEFVLCFHWAILPLAVVVRLLTGARLVYDEYDFYELNTLEGSGPKVFRATCGLLVRISHSLCLPFTQGVTCIRMAGGILRRRLMRWNRNVLELHNYPTRDWCPASDVKACATFKLHFVFVGGLFRVKGCELLASAFARLSDLSTDNTELHFFGRGEPDLAKQLGQQRGVVLHDDCRPHEIRRFLHRHLCVGVMLYQDGPRYRILGTNSRKMYEYLASGAPLLATALGEVRQFVADKQVGWLVPPNVTVDQLAATMASIAADRNDVRHRRERALAVMSRAEMNWEFEWRKFVDSGLLGHALSAETNSEPSPIRNAA